MRYLKVLVYIVVIFLILVFFFQNQNPLSQNLTLTLNLFFIAPMSSIPLPLYFLIFLAFFVGALLSLTFLVWDKVSLTARLMKSKWQISSLEREGEKLRKKIESAAARDEFMRTTAAKEQAQKTADKAIASAPAAAAAKSTSKGTFGSAPVSAPGSAPGSAASAGAGKQGKADIYDDITAPDPDKG